MNYEEDIRIDNSALDLEWEDQPVLMMRYSKNAAETRKTLDYAKEKVDLVRAELDKMIRTNPAEFSIEKITEGAIQSAIITHSRYIKVNAALIEAKYEADIAQGAVRAFDARKDALENLVRLHGQQYFAGPRIPRNLQEERAAKDQKANKRIAAATNMTRGR
jgi:hypothetical protein